MWGKLRTLGLVTLVTVLIWVWADAETQRGDLLQATPAAPLADEVEFVVDELPVVVALAAPAGRPAPRRLEVGQTVLRKVVITGPRPTIERIQARDGAFTLRAALVLDEADLSAGRVSKAVELLPSGFGLRFAGPAPTVQATIVP